MSEVDRLLLRLNRATRRWHGDIDEPWLHLLRPAVTEADYAAHLLRVYGFEAPLERACRYTPQLARLVEMRRLRRAGLLAQDLLALGRSPADVAAAPQCEDIPTFHSVADALGWLYVVARSTLLNERVHRHLAIRLPGVAQACTYLATFADTSVASWQQFGQALDVIGERPHGARLIVEAARAGSDCMQRWFEAARASRSRVG